MDTSLLIVGLVILVALAFDFVNGFHDAANSIATVVSTRVLSPRNAVIWAAFFNFVAAFFFETKVAATIGKGTVDASSITIWVVLSGLMGAILWDLLTWWWGLPTSSSHALVGGLAGAAVLHGGFAALKMDGITKILLFIVLSPTIGFVLGYAVQIAVCWIFRRQTPRRVDRFFRVGQLLSSAAYSLGHGFNDAQKTMGIILALLVAAKLQSADDATPVWVILTCHAAIAAGTLSGGWRIVKTMGMGLAHLKPVGGFCAETAGAITLIGASVAGIPVSTTHTITGSIVGVSSTQKVSGVRWGIASRIVWAWIFTIPGAAVISVGCYLLLQVCGIA